MPSVKGCIHTCGMMPEHVYAWTSWAYTMGVRYDGNWGYQFPKDPFGSQDRRQLGMYAYKPRHVKRKGRVDPFKSPVQVKKISSKEIRKNWFHTSRNIPFKEYMKKVPRYRNTLRNTKINLSDKAVEALVSIYSRREAPVVPPKPDVSKIKDRKAARAALTDHYEEMITMTKRASYELRSKLQYISAIGTHYNRYLAEKHLVMMDKATRINEIMVPRFRNPSKGGSIVLQEAALISTISKLLHNMHIYKDELRRYNAFNDRLQAELDKLKELKFLNYVVVDEDRRVLLYVLPEGDETTAEVVPYY